MIKNKITIAIFSLFLVGTTLHSTDALAQSSTEGVLTQVGSPSGVLEPLKGFAKDLPLISVMRQITPNGWIVKKSDTETSKLDTDMLVSWHGGGSWVETLGNLVRNYPVSASINWYKQEITLMPATARSAQRNMIFELEGTQVSNQIATGASGQTRVAPQAPVVSSWALDPNLSLKENVSAWAKKSGYSLVWLGEDYPLDKARVLSGDFDKDDGPIKQLSVDYGPKSRVQIPLSFQFFQNATLVVENWRFEQAGYPQNGSAQD